MAINPSSQHREFNRVLTSFTQSLTKEQQDDFRFSTLEDLQIAINDTQEKQGSEKKMRNLTRLRSFLEAVEQYGKVVEVFLNTSEFVAFVWVRLTLLDVLCDLQIANSDLGPDEIPVAGNAV